MCEFISWKEVRTPSGETEIVFLTANDVFNTKRGMELQKHTTREDWIGHGAIAFYFEIDSSRGKNHECTDFRSPDNFPPVIAEAIKAGKFAGLSPRFPAGLLRAPLYADYEAKLDSLYANYQAKLAPLYADYNAKLAPLDADYEAHLDSLYADYNARLAPLCADCWRAFRNPKLRTTEWQ